MAVLSKMLTRAATAKPTTCVKNTTYGAVAGKRTITFTTKTPFIATQLRNKAEIPVVSYEGGHRHEEVLTSNAAGSANPVKPPGQDDEKEAFPLKSSTVRLLTPTMEKFTLQGKVAVITGGARGLGYNMAQGLAEASISGIAIMDVQQDLGDQAAGKLSEQTGVDVRFYKVDIREKDGIDQTVQDIVEHYRNIDVVINAAGIADSNIKAEVYPLDKFRNLMEINVTGTFIVAQACAKQMIARGKGGSIINIASMSGSIVNQPQQQCCYNASKAAVKHLTKSLAAEWARYNIRVNSISPGYMDTALNRVPALNAQKTQWVELTPMKRLGNVDELNNLAVYLASEGSAFMTGNDCVIDGGYCLW